MQEPLTTIGAVFKNWFLNHDLKLKYLVLEILTKIEPVEYDKTYDLVKHYTQKRHNLTNAGL